MQHHDIIIRGYKADIITDRVYFKVWSFVPHKIVIIEFYTYMANKPGTFIIE